MGMNVVAPNKYPPYITPIPVSPVYPGNDQWYSIWLASRVMKSAGWVYKGSADGTGALGNTETTGAFLQDKWGPGGIVAGHIQLGSQTGASANIGTITNSVITINGLTGMTASSVGHSLTISGATNAVNNGTFTIVGFNSSSSVNIYNANSAIAEATSLIWSERVSGTGTITWSAISAGREQTISGLSGMTTSSAGHYLRLTGSSNSNNNGTFQILKYVSATSVVIVNTTGGADSASGDWTEMDPLLDVYPSLNVLNVGSWAVYQGPSTLKIPINATAVGNFIRGENITQSVSSAQGELIGYQYDVPSAQGYLVVMPRQNGSGSGRLGWSTAATTITGSSSGATVTTASGSTPIEYVREVVFAKSSSAAGHNSGNVFYCVVDAVAEATNRFSSLLGVSTNVQAPGNGIGTNAFPTIGTMVVRGTADTTGGTWLTAATADFGRTSVFAANADYTTNSSADGTWTIIMGVPTINTSAYVGMGFWRVDNNEDGDVDPYVWFANLSSSVYTDTRTSATGANTAEMFSHSLQSATWFKGMRRRGFSTNDVVQQFQTASISIASSSSVNPLIYAPTSDPDMIATSLSSIPPKVRDPIWIVSTQNATGTFPNIQGKMRKGILRWAFTVAGYSGNTTLDGKNWVQLSGTSGSWMLGPWDGVSPLLQT